MVQCSGGGMKMSKLLFFDIDGTLIECNLDIYSITENTRNALDSLCRISW